MKLPFTIAIPLLALLGAPAYAAEAGHTLFEQSCSGCHQTGGAGQSGLAPPVASQELWHAMDGKAETYLAGVLMGGLTGTIVSNGEPFVGLAMPPHDWLSDEEALAIADYVLNDLNGLDIEITSGPIIEAREKPPSHSALRAMRKEVLP